MKILTVAMRVPDSRASLKVAADGSGMATVGLKFVCNPFDDRAIEQAVQLREKRSDIEEIVVLTAGGHDANQVLRTALAMGCDRAIHLVGDDLPGHDEIAMARLLAATIRRGRAMRTTRWNPQPVPSRSGVNARPSSGADRNTAPVLK